MNNLRRFLPYLKPHRKALALGLLCMVLSGLLGGGFLFLAQRVLEPMLNAGLSNRARELNFFTLVFLGTALLRAFADFGQVFVTQRVGQRLLTKLRDDLFNHLLRLTVGFFEGRRTGEIMSRLTNDLAALQQAMTNAVTTAISSPIELAIGLGYMFYANWRLSMMVFIILPLVGFLTNRAGRRVRGATSRLQGQLAELSNYLQEKIAAMRLIQTFGTQAHEARLFAQVNQAAYEGTMEPIRIRAALAPAIEFTGMFGVTLGLWFGAQDVLAGRMSAAALITFLIAVQRAAMRLRAIAGLSLLFRQAEAAATRIFEVLDTQPEVRDAPDALDLTGRDVRGHLAFEDVRFSYPGGPQVLHGISFEVQPGEVVALVGLSGSGKSTIASLVPRLYDPQGGRVLLDGLDLRDVTLASLRAHIGAVPQETTLFHGTIRDNIAYACPEASHEQVLEASRRAHADEFIRVQPEGYHAPIGERGGKLSGGQRQRLAIARALLRDPKILILDEATSSLDAHSERLVQDALAALMEGRTTLIIAHRFSTIQRADRILVLEDGRIVESGTHEQLLRQSGRYFQLHQMQAFVAPPVEGHGDEAETNGAAAPLPVT